MSSKFGSRQSLEVVKVWKSSKFGSRQSLEVVKVARVSKVPSRHVSLEPHATIFFYLEHSDVCQMQTFAP
jgi:hypothetical protein